MGNEIAGRDAGRSQPIGRYGRAKLNEVSASNSPPHSTESRAAPRRLTPRSAHSTQISPLEPRRPPPAMNPVFDQIGTSVFETMSRFAREHEAINLGQGFPDDPGPEDVRARAAEAVVSGWNQYPPMLGLPELRSAVAAHYKRFQGLELATNPPPAPMKPMRSSRPRLRASRPRRKCPRSPRRRRCSNV